MYISAMVSAISIGIILTLFNMDGVLSSALSHTLAILIGFFSFTVMHVFGRFHTLISEDDELVEAIYQKIRSRILGKFGGKNAKK